MLMNIVFLLKPKSAVAYVNAKSSLRQGLEKMRYHGYKALPVIDESGCYVGTVSEGDFLWHIVDSEAEGEQRLCEGTLIRDIIDRDKTRAVRINATLGELLDIAMEQNFAPVVDDRGSFVGIVTRSDIIRYLSRDINGQSSNVHTIA